MSKIEKLINDVNSTHCGLGELVAVCTIASKARKFTLIVSPSGCGKSTIMEYIGRKTPNAYMPTSISIASLANKVDKLTSFRSVIVIDDIAVIQTEYARNATITALSALCYSHRVEPSMFGFDFSIEDFYGSALIGIQPVLLRGLMLSPEWDASIQDKALRYYHLIRPLEPTLTALTADFPKGIDFDKVEDFDAEKHQLWPKLYDLGMIQWSRARTKQHIVDFLKAISAIEERENVIDNDYKLLLHLLQPMAIEAISITKTQLEGERNLDNNLVALLTEYYTYDGKFLLAQVATDFKVTIQQAYRIMKAQNGSWQQTSKSPTIYEPSKNLMELLRHYNLEIRG